MATRAEQYRANAQRGNGKSPQPAKRTKAGAAPTDRPRLNKHAARKATYALELTEKSARPSRKSTRASANRAKADSAFNVTEQVRKGSPEARFRRAKAQATRARSSQARG